MIMMFFASWSIFPIFFLLGPEGFKVVSLGTSILLQAIGDLLSKNLVGILINKKKKKIVKTSTNIKKSGLSKQRSEMEGGLSRQSSEMEGGLSRQSSETEGGLSRQSSEMEGGLSETQKRSNSERKTDEIRNLQMNPGLIHFMNSLQHLSPDYSPSNNKQHSASTEH